MAEAEDATFKAETKADGEADAVLVAERRDEDDGSSEVPATC
jgi:hypothetical protein